MTGIAARIFAELLDYAVGIYQRRPRAAHHRAKSFSALEKLFPRVKRKCGGGYRNASSSFRSQTQKASA